MSKWRLILLGPLPALIGGGLCWLAKQQVSGLEDQPQISAAGVVTEKHAAEITLWVGCYIVGLFLVVGGLGAISIQFLRWIERWRNARKKEPRGFPLD